MAAERLILTADDNQQIRMLVKAALRSLGHELMEAVDGEQALELAIQRTPDLILLDVTMPKLDGIATFRELVRMREDVRAILSSGYARDEIMTPLQSLGLFGFLQKPYTLHDLVAAIQDLPESAEMD